MINQELENYLNKKVLAILHQKYCIRVLERDDKEILSSVIEWTKSEQGKLIENANQYVKRIEYALKDKKKIFLTLASMLYSNVKANKDEILVLVPEQLDLKTFREDKKINNDFFQSFRKLIENAMLGRHNIYKTEMTV